MDESRKVFIRYAETWNYANCTFWAKRYVYEDEGYTKNRYDKDTSKTLIYNPELLDIWKLFNGTYYYSNNDEVTAQGGVYVDGWFADGRDESYYGF